MNLVKIGAAEAERMIMSYQRVYRSDGESYIELMPNGRHVGSYVKNNYGYGGVLAAEIEVDHLLELLKERCDLYKKADVTTRINPLKDYAGNNVPETEDSSRLMNALCLAGYLVVLGLVAWLFVGSMFPG
ncbi:MAG: hypothetical protein ACN2B6_00340 [Rickettsiales bacterium]